MPPRKKQREGKRPMETPSQFYPWDGAPIFFDSQEELQRFQTHFETKPIVPIRTCNPLFLELKNATVVHHALESGHWYGFLAMPYQYINTTLIQAFYSNLQRSPNGEIFTKVNGHEILLSESNLHDISGLPIEGAEELPQVDISTFLQSIGVTFNPQGGLPTTKGMEFQYRLLLYFISYIIKPRKHSHTTITHEDALLMHTIINSTPFNWCKFLLINMIDATSPERELPYPFLVMRILENEGFNLKKGNLVKKTKLWVVGDATFKRHVPPSAPSQPPPISISSSKPTLKDVAASLNSLHQKVDKIADFLCQVHDVDPLQRYHEEEAGEDEEEDDQEEGDD